jgi:hypothetical protein
MDCCFKVNLPGNGLLLYHGFTWVEYIIRVLSKKRQVIHHIANRKSALFFHSPCYCCSLSLEWSFHCSYPNPSLVNSYLSSEVYLNRDLLLSSQTNLYLVLCPHSSSILLPSFVIKLLNVKI